MAVCKFYQQGHCRFGNNCRFEHPARGQSQPNRFGPPSGPASDASSRAVLAKYSISADVIERDLTVEKPHWILSAYAPGRDAPGQLFGGYPREQSFEELRLQYTLAKASGNEQQILNEAQALYRTAQEQMDNVVRNVQEAARYVADGENRHPNRHDICREGTHGAPFGEFLASKRAKPMADESPWTNPFASGAGGASSSSPFGQPTSLGSQTNPFGQPAQPASAFGQPSQPSSLAFGQASQPGSGGSGPAFGQGAQPAPAFGQPSALGAKPNPFANAAAAPQPAQPNPQGSAFGQPSQLGQKVNPFAATSSISTPFASMTPGDTAAGAANPFGAPSLNQANAAPSAFASNVANQSNGAPGAFGASPFMQLQPSTTAPNPFASASQPQAQEAKNVFAQTAQPQTNGVFGQPAAGGNIFGQSTAQQPAAPRASPFGSPATQQGTAAAAAAAAATAAAVANPYPPGSSRQHPPLESYSTRSMNGGLTRFKGKAVAFKEGRPCSRAPDGTWTRIWFPSGPPAYCRDTELAPEQYDEGSRAQWQAFARTGAFADGVMPELPPPRECTLWDF